MSDITKKGGSVDHIEELNLAGDNLTEESIDDYLYLISRSTVTNF